MCSRVHTSVTNRCCSGHISPHTSGCSVQTLLCMHLKQTVYHCFWRHGNLTCYKQRTARTQSGSSCNPLYLEVSFYIHHCFPAPFVHILCHVEVGGTLISVHSSIEIDGSTSRQLRLRIPEQAGLVQLSRRTSTFICCWFDGQQEVMSLKRWTYIYFEGCEG